LLQLRQARLIGSQEYQRIAVIPLPGASRHQDVLGGLLCCAVISLGGMRMGRAKNNKPGVRFIANIARGRVDRQGQHGAQSRPIPEDAG
jgi:hypothetical protein